VFKCKVCFEPKVEQDRLAPRSGKRRTIVCKEHTHPHQAPYIEWCCHRKIAGNLGIALLRCASLYCCNRIDRSKFRR
jgi:hypothetical protein